MITKRIQILIKEDTKFGKLNDALYFSEEEYAKLDEKDIQIAVDERVQNYEANQQAIKDTPPVEPTEAELIAIKESLALEKDRVVLAIQDIDSKLSAQIKPIK